MKENKKNSSLISRRKFVTKAGLVAAGTLAMNGTNLASILPQVADDDKKSGTVKLDWKEVYYTNCPMVSANNIDQELGWCKTDFKKIGVDYSLLQKSSRKRFLPTLHS